MSDRAAPRVFISYARDSPAHEDQVRDFATFLRSGMGMDARLDQWYENIRRDWTIWTTEQLADADFILVIASPEYRRRAEGTAAPDEGRRSQLEAAMIRDNLTKNLRRGTERILPVVLPGKSAAHIPAFLNPHSTTMFHIKEFTARGVSALLAAITGHGQYPMPERGTWQSGEAESERAMLINGMRWLASGPDVRTAGVLIDGVLYNDSIVLRPMSSTAGTRGFVEVDLGGAYFRMTSVAGVLDDASETFQVGHFQVCVDGRPLWEGRAALGKPATVEVNVTGARRLRLEMSRSGAAGSPLHSGVSAAGRLPELAWGNPALS